MILTMSELLSAKTRIANSDITRPATFSFQEFDYYLYLFMGYMPRGIHAANYCCARYFII